MSGYEYTANTITGIVHTADCALIKKYDCNHYIEFQDLSDEKINGYTECDACLNSDISDYNELNFN